MHSLTHSNFTRALSFQGPCTFKYICCFHRCLSTHPHILGSIWRRIWRWADTYFMFHSGETESGLSYLKSKVKIPRLQWNLSVCLLDEQMISVLPHWNAHSLSFVGLWFCPAGRTLFYVLWMELWFTLLLCLYSSLFERDYGIWIIFKGSLKLLRSYTSQC